MVAFLKKYSNQKYMLETTNYNQYKKIFLFLIISFVSTQKLRAQTFSYANDSVIYIFYGKTEKSITLEARTKREYKPFNTKNYSRFSSL